MSRPATVASLLLFPLAGWGILVIPSTRPADGPAASRAIDPGAIDPVMFRGGPAHTGVYATPGLDGYGGIRWRTPLPGPVRATAAVAGDLVYVGSAGGWLHALDRLTGEERWRYRAGAAVHGSPAVSGGAVYVTDLQSTLHAVDARAGRSLWRLETGPLVPFPWGHESGDIYASSPTLAEAGGRTLLYFGAGDGSLYAVDPRDGEVVWDLETGGRIRSTPAVAEGRVVVGSADGVVYAADAETGELLWRRATRGAELRSGKFGYDRRTIQSSPAIADGRVHIGARDGFLYTLDLATGERLWDADHEISWVNSSPAVAEGRVFAGSSDRRFVHALDAATGEELWRRDSEGIVWTSPIVLGGEVIFAEGAGRIRSLDVETGETRWSTFLPHRLWSSPVVVDGVLYIGTHGGGMYALRGAEGHPLRRAVVWDSTLTAAAWYVDHERLAAWLSRRGYEPLDAASAERWLDARVRDGERSAVVFAIDHLPARLLEGGPDSPLRRYLEAGGTVVWPGYPPAIWRRDLETGETGGLSAVSWRGPLELLGVDHDAGNFDEMGAWATDEGRRLGLPDAWHSRWDVAPAEGLEALAVDERGHLASWRRSYGGPPGTGFVRLWGDRSEPPDLAPFLVAAEWRPALSQEVAPGTPDEPARDEAAPEEDAPRADTTSAATPQVERLASRDAAWTFTGESEVQVRGGQDVIYLRRGRALRPDVSFSDGTIEFDILPSDHRTFLGLLFRRGEGDHTEDIYFRLHKSGLPDAIQYTPDYRGHGQWQLYHGAGATAAARFAPGHWQRVRIEVRGERAAAFVGAASEPQLVVDRLRAGAREGHIGFWGNFPGATADDPPAALLRDVTVRHGETTYAFPPPERTGVPGIIREWGLSRPFAREGDVVRELPPAVREVGWRTLVAEPSGLLPLDRDMPRPDEGVATVLAGLRIHADSDRVARLDLGFSDHASVFLNERLLYSGNYGFTHNFPRRQGLITLDQAALYLPLERGANELVVAVSEVFGGWGIMGRIEDREGLSIEPLRADREDAPPQRRLEQPGSAPPR